MGRRFTRGRGRLGSPRLTAWAGIGLGATTLTSTGGTILNSLGTAALALRLFTVIRIHMEVLMVSDQEIASEVQVAGIGAAVVSDQANAIGVTAVPTPITDLGSDLWFMHQLMMTSIVVLDATGTTTEDKTYSIDSKSMRKVNDDQDVIIAAEFSGTGSGLSIFTGGRLLLKMH